MNNEKNLEQRLAELEQLVASMEKLLHNRVNLSNTRISHIEHYLGLRKHSFVDGERMWDFQQVTRDVSLKERPKSRFYKGEASSKRRSDAA